MYTGSEGLSLQANFVILGLLRLEMLSFVTRFNISGFNQNFPQNITLSVMLESVTTEVGAITAMLTTQRSDRVVLNHLIFNLATISKFIRRFK
jgi:hypothetical protein